MLCVLNVRPFKAFISSLILGIFFQLPSFFFFFDHTKKLRKKIQRNTYLSVADYPSFYQQKKLFTPRMCAPVWYNSRFLFVFFSKKKK